MASVSQTTYDAFNRDVQENTGYIYTTNARLSSRMANRRLSDITLRMADWQGKNVIDIGCGDGTYSFELFRRGRLKSLTGVDPASEAIAIAHAKTQNPNLTFAAHDAYDLPFEDQSFDIAHVRGVLHHVDDAAAVLKEAFRVAPVVVVIDPNGYNPGLKVLEKVSPYHRAHGEKSYPPAALDQWVREVGGVVQKRTFAGLVPFFCPDVLACTLKFFEPLVERTPGLNQIGCAVYVFRASK